MNMSKSVDPVINQWYHYPQKAQKFQITAIDGRAETVEIQYFDGNLDEFDLTTWYALEMERVEEPEDWTGPMDNLETDDLNQVGTEMLREDWAAPYDEELEKMEAGPRITEEEQQEEEG
jgi:hypothetical protein